ncbi:MAG: glycine cleavage system protein GcvH [Myxococcota bacterium]|nr:glycine cleavage system protein GcvH [Myxococcota bacterium]
MTQRKDYEIPQDCRYARTDEWIRSEGESVRLGISDYAQSELSDVVYVDLPAVGRALTAGESFGVVESVKAVSDLIAPVTGEVSEVNLELEEHPEWINEDPYGRGWILCLRSLAGPDATDLLSPDAYRKFVEERSGS